MSFEEAIEAATRDERFRATLYAMNTLLLEKGVYTRGEFDRLFTEWIEKETGKKQHGSSSASLVGADARR